MLWYRLEALYNDTQPRPAIVITAHYTNTREHELLFGQLDAYTPLVRTFSFSLFSFLSLGTLPPISSRLCFRSISVQVELNCTQHRDSKFCLASFFCFLRRGTNAQNVHTNRTGTIVTSTVTKWNAATVETLSRWNKKKLAPESYVCICMCMYIHVYMYVTLFCTCHLPLCLL